MKRLTQPIGWWVRRYLAQDLSAWAGALLLGTGIYAVSGRLDAMAFGAALGDSVGFYGAAWIRERRFERRSGIRSGAYHRLRRIAGEFAVPELLDTTLMRPLATLAAATFVSSPGLAIAIGGVIADVVFYSIAGVCAHSRNIRFRWMFRLERGIARQA